MHQAESHEEFQEKLLKLCSSLLPLDGMRFDIYLPQANLDYHIGSDGEIDSMNEGYKSEYWECDPMHPSLFEGKDTIVITNSMLMTDFAWQKTRMYKEFFKPHSYFHNADVFFRQNGVIIAVLTLLRKDPAKMFTDQEVSLLKKIQPFIEYCLKKVYLPKRIYDRESLSEEFGFTARELDVVELALTGASNKILVKQLKISMPTLRTHMQNIYSKVDVHSSTELIAILLPLLAGSQPTKSSK